MKIFGIGLSRTGTASLTSALEILGYSAKHFPSLVLSHGFWLRLNERDMETYQALTDLPVARFYKKLDQKYAGSKFIFTERHIDTWLHSCSHFGRFRKSHVKWPKKIVKLRRQMYGCEYYDRELFRRAYERHQRDVYQYFRNRPDDLLKMNIVNGDGWALLCGFLNKKVPDVPFPHKNIATHRQGYRNARQS